MMVMMMMMVMMVVMVMVVMVVMVAIVGCMSEEGDQKGRAFVEMCLSLLAGHNCMGEVEASPPPLHHHHHLNCHHSHLGDVEFKAARIGLVQRFKLLQEIELRVVMVMIQRRGQARRTTEAQRGVGIRSEKQ
jgi:hypothetical protein